MRWIGSKSSILYVSVLAPSTESALTLVTCYPFYLVGPAPRRFVVHAHHTPPPALPATNDNSVQLRR